MTAKALFKTQPEDFFVEEVLGFEPEGEGEHLFVHIEKRGMNTQWAAKLLGEACGVKERDVSHSGLKDRHAVTRQWLSVWLPGKETPDLAGLESIDLHILKARRHNRKLRIGTHKANGFRIRLREVSEPALVEERLQKVAAEGFANIFGDQRFGQGERNLEIFDAVLAGKRMKKPRQAMAISAARSHLFNRVAEHRQTQGLMRQVLPGDVLMLAGSHSVFVAEEAELDSLQQRLAEGDVQLTGPLWGKGGVGPQGDALALELAAVAAEGERCAGLEKLANGARRPLWLKPEIQWHWDGGDLLLEFTLPTGSFATALLGNLAELVEPDRFSEAQA
ncbi:tRNA pseudouridine(13) synthase TruD [Gallaecimonas kandeliae]|uniref:tRNA pseudouridine(13) synthase TruD n=1 Tax=Gallaecimonas kandeliae TaxID=3029055 RepID=UPI002649DCDC|nr:tRNA pseudouridine(13) synthase TruD [Gallaecimonas kandeliae]WKE66451.1 tRNA pseudouridine(13) synthase TruD [Gallaecimonas kandeliae]